MIKVMQNSIIRPYRAFTVAAVLLFSLLLASCSVVRLGYNHGESLTYWWMNSYVDFDSDQTPWVKKSIEQFFAWHRKTQLKDYVAFLTSSQKRIQQRVSKQDVLANYNELKKRAALAVDKALPDLARLALSLKPDQIARMEKKFASNNDKYRKEYLSGDLEQRQRSRYKKVMEQAEYWFGDFSREQEALIRRTSDARPMGAEFWLAERMRRQRDLIAILKKIQSEKPNQEAVVQMLKTYANNMFDPQLAGERAQFFNASQDATADLAAVIINSTTPAQKAHAVQQMQQWIDNFRTLAQGS
jgi:hypothetical protein